MKMQDIPFNTVDWAQIPPVEKRQMQAKCFGARSSLARCVCAWWSTRRVSRAPLGAKLFIVD